MAITDWPRDERPREKLLHRGPQALSDAELLAIFLRTGVPGKTAVDVARELLGRFGSLRAFLTAPADEVCDQSGVGEAKYVMLQAALEVGRRHLAERLQRGTALESVEDTRRYLQAQLRDRPHEVFCCLFLDNRHRVLAFEELFRGTLNGTAVYPREIVKRAMYYNAAAVILLNSIVCRMFQLLCGTISKGVLGVFLRWLFQARVFQGAPRLRACEPVAM